MREYLKFNRILEDIYDTALDSALWGVVLNNITGFVGGQAGALVLQDSTRKFTAVEYHVGLDPDCVQSYERTYSKFDPFAAVSLFDVERIVSIPDVMSYDEYLQGRVYREWSGPQGWGDVVSAVLDKSATSCSFLSIVLNQASGMVDDDMRQRMALVVPHIRRALLIGKALELKQTEAATFADTLDGLSTGLFLIDSVGRVVHGNAAGHDMLRENNFLNSIGGRLVASDTQVNQTLRRIFLAAQSGDPAIDAKGVALPLMADSGEHYVAHVLPLTAGARHRTGIAYGAATAALFVRKAALETSSATGALSKTYKLTPAELRVLLAIVDVGGVPEIAAAFGVAEATIKTHLSHLFEKMGASRQADLVRLVAGFSTFLTSAGRPAA